MATLQDTVRDVVQAFMDSDGLFTALDVSNKVKTLLPHARHREVRDEVRSLFTSFIEPQGWARSPITVTLEDNSTAEALLYHPLSAAWDLDAKYDQQKRSQVSFNPSSVAAAAVSAASVTATAATVATPAPSTQTVATVQTSPMPTARDLWKQMFATQPSLFPTK